MTTTPARDPIDRMAFDLATGSAVVEPAKLRAALDAYAAEARAAALDQAADAVVELRDTTDVNVAEYQRYDFRQRVALGDAERKLRRMAAAARPDDTTGARS